MAKRGNILFITVAAISVFFSACSNKQVKYYWDLESPVIAPWSGNPKLFSNAFSGKHADTLSVKHNPYSVSFVSTVKDITPNKISTVKLKFKALWTSYGCKGRAVISFGSRENPLFWDGIALGDYVLGKNEWQTVKCKTKIPEDIALSPDDEVLVFIWCNEGEPFYVDDISILFEID